jgi:hypothetical protein
MDEALASYPLATHRPYKFPRPEGASAEDWVKYAIGLNELSRNCRRCISVRCPVLLRISGALVQAFVPPSTVRLAPVMYAASGSES